jgi:hypothetical protein
VRVAEVRANVWQATIDGRPVGRAAYLPPLQGRWRAVATTESWRAGRAGCNHFAYRFESVSVLGSTWQGLTRAARVGQAIPAGPNAFSARS